MFGWRFKSKVQKYGYRTASLIPHRTLNFLLWPLLLSYPLHAFTLCIVYIVNYQRAQQKRSSPLLIVACLVKSVNFRRINNWWLRHLILLTSKETFRLQRHYKSCPITLSKQHRDCQQDPAKWLKNLELPNVTHMWLNNIFLFTVTFSSIFNNQHTTKFYFY